MQMDVEDRLSRIAVRIENSPEPARRDSAFPSNSCSPPHHLADQTIVFLTQIVQRGDVALGYDENVRGCLWVDVVECEQKSIFIHDGARDLSIDDFAEEAVGHGSDS